MAARRPPRRLWLAALLALGCARFQPVTPLRAQNDEIDVQLTSLRIGRFGQIAFATRSAGAHALSQAWLTVPTRSPCSGGAELNDIRVDGKAWSVLPAGEHELTVWPASGTLTFPLDTVVDIQSDVGCLRVPAVSQSVPMVPTTPPAVVIGGDVLFLPMPTGLRALLGVDAGLGQWLGPVQLMAEAGVGTAVCQEWACGRDTQNQLRDGVAIPISLGARTSLGSFTVAQFASVGFLEARALVTRYSLPLPDGDRWFTAESGFVALGWGYMDLPPGPFRHLERAVQMEMAVPLGVTAQSVGGRTHAAFTGGLTIRFLLPL